MMEYENNDPANQDDYPDAENDRVQDASNADAAKFNSDEQEQALNERISTANETDNAFEVNAEKAYPGDMNNKAGEELGGATNLSLDQLKEETGPEGL